MFPFQELEHCVTVFFFHLSFSKYWCATFMIFVVCALSWSSIASSVMDHHDREWLLSHFFISIHFNVWLSPVIIKLLFKVFIWTHLSLKTDTKQLFHNNYFERHTGLRNFHLFHSLPAFILVGIFHTLACCWFGTPQVLEYKIQWVLQMIGNYCNEWLR